MKIARTLTLLVVYETNDTTGAEIHQLEQNLDNIGVFISGNGLFTEGTSAEVETWEHRILPRTT